MESRLGSSLALVVVVVGKTDGAGLVAIHLVAVVGFLVAVANGEFAGSCADAGMKRTHDDDDDDFPTRPTRESKVMLLFLLLL